jgi:hypothetical protein
MKPIATTRSASGTPTGRLAIWWVIASEIVIFGGLTYFLHHSNFLFHFTFHSLTQHILLNLSPHLSSQPLCHTLFFCNIILKPFMLQFFNLLYFHLFFSSIFNFKSILVYYLKHHSPPSLSLPSYPSTTVSAFIIPPLSIRCHQIHILFFLFATFPISLTFISIL